MRAFRESQTNEKKEEDNARAGEGMRRTRDKRTVGATAPPGPDLQCLQVKLLSKMAALPTRGSFQSAGFDLSSAEKTVVLAGGRAVAKTDLSIACPTGTYARIAPRR